MSCIYVLENTTNSKSYTGQTINKVEKRWKSHKGSDSYIGRAIRKYGWDNFKTYTYYVPEELLDYFEIEMIKKANSLAPNGYNLDSGGSKGRPSDETKKRMSEAQKGKIPWNKGISMSDIAKKNMSIANKGRKYKSMSIQGRENISKSSIGRKFSEETKNKLSIANKGKKQKIVICPHCSKSGGISIMKRYHFDNCKMK